MPRGYVDFARQVVIWLAFYFGYLAVRSVVDRDPTKAVLNGIRVIDFEQRTMHHLFEQTAQRIADSSHLLLTLAAWTYWNSEFTVIGLALLFIYLRRHERFGSPAASRSFVVTSSTSSSCCTRYLRSSWRSPRTARFYRRRPTRWHAPGSTA